MKRRLVIADDSGTIHKVIAIALSAFDVEILSAHSLIEALMVARERPIDMVIADVSLPGVKTSGDYQKIAGEAGGVPLLLLLGSYDSTSEAELRAAGYGHILKKPFEMADLVSSLTTILGTPFSAKGAQREPTSLPPTPPQRAAGVPEASAVPPPPMKVRVPSEVRELELDLGGESAPGFSLDRSSGFVPPPIGLTDESRRGQKAFQGDSAKGGKAAGASLPFQVSGSDSYDDQDDDLSFKGPRTPEGAAFSGARSLSPGWDDELDEREPLSPPPPPPTTAPPSRVVSVTLPPPPLSGLGLTDEDLGGSLGSTRFAPMSDANLPPVPPPPPSAQVDRNSSKLSDSAIRDYVREYLEEYCATHFRTLAKEVITAELRRLADEKARHLIDN